MENAHPKEYNAIKRSGIKTIWAQQLLEQQ